jgi:hypothetical protein
MPLVARTKLPSRLRWLFWEMDFESLDPERHADSILARILERGCMADVQWAIRYYGMERIHRFFREAGSPELSKRTIGFWRAVFKAEDEKWASPPAWRKNSSAPWIS